MVSQSYSTETERIKREQAENSKPNTLAAQHENDGMHIEQEAYGSHMPGYTLGIAACECQNLILTCTYWDHKRCNPTGQSSEYPSKVQHPHILSSYDDDKSKDKRYGA